MAVRQRRARTSLQLPIRYMGTKRQLAPVVRRVVGTLRRGGRVADLFGGMGSVSRAMAPRYPVLLNDQLSFAVAIARAQLTDGRSWTAENAVLAVKPRYDEHRRRLREVFSDRLADEAKATRAGGDELQGYVASAPHVGNSVIYANRALGAALQSDADRYQLVTLYFASSYFSTEQAIELDAMRYAIDSARGDTSQLMAAWLSVASAVMNAPGHTAQYLRPHSPDARLRVVRQWVRSPFAEFALRIRAVRPVSSRRWRTLNRVNIGDALDLIVSETMDDVKVVYADPPYTRDHYSRYYHVLETMFRYDFPSSSGAGRYRSDRFRTSFSVASEVESAFRALARGVSVRRLPLVLSYPANGLLERAGVSTLELLQDFFTVREVKSFQHTHSTLGGSSGLPTKEAMERIYVCVP